MTVRQSGLILLQRLQRTRCFTLIHRQMSTFTNTCICMYTHEHTQRGSKNLKQRDTCTCT